MYLKNLLGVPGGITLEGVPIDLSKVKVPAYFISTAEDHIAPWKTTYKGSQYLGGDVRFVLGGSGHIAGIVNPPAAKKYHYWTNEARPGIRGRLVQDRDPAPGLVVGGLAGLDGRAQRRRRRGRVLGPSCSRANPGRMPLEDAPGQLRDAAAELRQVAQARDRAGAVPGGHLAVDEVDGMSAAASAVLPGAIP